MRPSRNKLHTERSAFFKPLVSSLRADQLYSRSIVRDLPMAVEVADGAGKLKLYVHLGSQPARAVTIFCRANNIAAEEIMVDLLSQETRTPEFRKQINPMGQVPCINDDGFKLHESHAILRYLATTRRVSDHWYPKDQKKRALIDATLDWHHLNLRRYASQLCINRVFVKIPANAGFFPRVNNEALAMEAANMLPHVLDQLESMLHHSKFLQNADQVSIADLSLACEMTQLQVLGNEGQKNLLGSYERIATWMADVKEATHPHFAEVHQVICEYANHIEGLRAHGDL